MITALAINPLALALGRDDIFDDGLVHMKPPGDVESGNVAYKPIVRLPGGDILFGARFANEAAMQEPIGPTAIFTQLSIHVAGKTVPGVCFIVGPREEKNGSYTDYTINPDMVRRLITFGGPTGQHPRPLNDHLFGTNLSYTDKGKTKLISEEDCGFDVEEGRFPFGYRIASGREAIHTFVRNTGFDPNATVGFDEGMETYFFQSGLYADGEEERPLVWLGTRYGEFQSLHDLLFAMKQRGIYHLSNTWRP